MCGTLLGEVGRAAVSAEAHPANASAKEFFLFRHTHTIGPSDDDDDDDDTVRSVSGRSFALLGSSTSRACDGGAFRGRLEGSPGSPRGRRVTRAGRVERRKDVFAKKEKSETRLDVVAGCSYPANTAPPNPPAAARAEDAPEPRFALSFPMSRRIGQCATRWRAHVCRRGGGKKLFLESTRAPPTPREIGQALAASVIPASVSGRTRLGANPESTWPNW